MLYWSINIWRNAANGFIIYKKKHSPGKRKSDLIIEGDIEIIGISLELRGDLYPQRNILFQKVTWYSARSLVFCRLFGSYNSHLVLDKVIKYYNAKLEKYCVANDPLICKQNCSE